MRNTTIRKAMLCSLLLIVSLHSQAKPKSGDISITGAAASRFFSYENDEAKNELPDDVVALLDDTDLTGDDSDILNYSLGVGYYLTDNLHIGIVYTDGIELGFLDDLDNFLSSGFDNQDGFVSFDGDMQIVEIDARYKVFELSSSINAFVTAGLAIHSIDVDVDNVDDGERTRLASASETNTGAKLGFGFQWDMARHWALHLKYEHFTFMSIDNTSLMLEYRFQTLA